MDNNSYYNRTPIFPGTSIYSSDTPTRKNITNYNDIQLPFEQSYIENILRMNKGKKVRVHITIPGSEQFKDREFAGIIEESGRDHIILSEPSTGKWQLLLMIYVDFISFDEAINYVGEFNNN